MSIDWKDPFSVCMAFNMRAHSAIRLFEPSHEECVFTRLTANVKEGKKSSDRHDKKALFLSCPLLAHSLLSDVLSHTLMVITYAQPIT